MLAEFQPYLGPRPFERVDEALFFGRDPEASELVSLILAHAEVLVYAQSGAGKTSLVNAKLVPMLEQEGCEVLPQARVQAPLPPGIEAQAIPNLYVFHTLVKWAKNEVDAKSLATLSLADYLQTRPRLTDEFDMPKPRIAIFDQFEELLTYYPERWKDRQEFFKQVHDALEKDPSLRVLFLMREDYIAGLDPYIKFLPEKLRTRFRLEQLRERAALSAITGPLANSEFRFEEGVAERLVENLLRVPTKNPGSEWEVGQYVEPVQLQVVCQNLWQALAPDERVITRMHLDTYGDVTQALSGYYEKAIKSGVTETGVKEGEIRAWFGSVLITPEGIRSRVLRGANEAGGLPNSAVDLLERLHLIKGELRGSAHWYELSHDRLVEPIRKSNEQWLIKWSAAGETWQRLEKRAKTWETGGRGSRDLLKAGELHEAERWLGSPAASELKPSKDLLALVQNSRSYQRTGRLRLGLVALSLLIILMLGMTVFAFNERAKAKASAANAQASEAKAKASADEALKNEKDARDQAEEARKARDATTKQTELAMLRQEEAERAKDEAKKQQALAERGRKDAETAKIEADKLRALALTEKKAANEQRVLAEHQRQQAEHQRQEAEIAKAKAERQAEEIKEKNKELALALQAAETIQNEANRDKAEALNQVGEEAFNKGDTYAAIKSYTEAIQSNDYDKAYFNRAIAYQKKGDKKQAIEDFSKAIALTNDTSLRQRAEANLKELQPNVNPVSFKFDKEKFFAEYQEAFGQLSQSQADGLATLLGLIEEDSAMVDERWVAYLLATIKWETAHTFRPITEYGSEKYFEKFEPGTSIGRALGNTQPGDGLRYRGRGYVLITGRKLYDQLSEILYLGFDFQPEDFLKPSIAYPVVSYSMTNGLLTGKKLSDYIYEKGADYIGARKIIDVSRDNRTEIIIADYAKKFEDIVRASRVRKN